MPATGTVTLTGSVSGGAGGGKSVAPPTISNANACNERLEQTLASGDNTITVPSNAVSVTIVPPPGNAVVLKLKGAAGDTGVRISTTNFTELGFDAGATASFIVNAASAISALTIFDFV